MLNSTTNMLRYLKWHIDPLPSTWKSCFIVDFSNNICFNQQLRNKNSRFTRFKDWYCWWFRNPVPVDVADIPASIGFHTSQVVSRISEPSVSTTFTWLVVSTHLKNISQMGNLPQIVVKIKKHIWNHHLDFFGGSLCWDIIIQYYSIQTRWFEDAGESRHHQDHEKASRFPSLTFTYLYIFCCYQDTSKVVRSVSESRKFFVKLLAP